MLFSIWNGEHVYFIFKKNSIVLHSKWWTGHKSLIWFKLVFAIWNDEFICFKQNFKKHSSCNVGQWTIRSANFANLCSTMPFLQFLFKNKLKKQRSCWMILSSVSPGNRSWGILHQYFYYSTTNLLSTS